MPDPKLDWLEWKQVVLSFVRTADDRFEKIEKIVQDRLDKIEQRMDEASKKREDQAVWAKRMVIGAIITFLSSIAVQILVLFFKN